MTYSESRIEMYKHTIGIKASNISGYGAFYRYKISKSVRVQASGIFYMLDSDRDNEVRDLSGYTYGIEIQKDIVQRDMYRIYLLTGGFYYHNDDKIENESHMIKDSWNYGIGCGLEYLFHRVTVGGELGYKYYYDTGEKWNPTDEWRNFIQETTKIGAGLTLGVIF